MIDDAFLLSLLEKLVRENNALNDQVTSVQIRCTELLEEARTARAEIKAVFDAHGIESDESLGELVQRLANAAKRRTRELETL